MAATAAIATPAASSTRPPARSCPPGRRPGRLLTRPARAPMARSILVTAKRAAPSGGTTPQTPGKEAETMPDHLEIEQKFDVGEHFQRPGFGALPGMTAAAPVTRHLSATYFDTPGMRLAAAKITLRRRT